MIRLLMCLLLLLASAPPILAGTIAGRVVSEQEPLAGMLVSVYRTVDFSQPPVASAEMTNSDGLFRLQLPAGDYALFATDLQGRWFAFCGRNPITVRDDETWAGLQAVPVQAAQISHYDDEYTAGLEGVVIAAGQPLAGATVYLYLDTTEALKGQGYRMSPPTAADGRFYFDALPESSYFLVVRQRMNGAAVGPVLAGDRFGVYPGNPLLLRSGKVVSVTLPTAEKLKNATGSESFGPHDGLILTGRIVGPQGTPAVGLHVFAYTDRVIGHQRPAALSAPTAENGEFRLVLPAAGTYFIGAREFYGDSPAPGERFGMYEGSADHGLEITEGAVMKEMMISVAPIDL